MVTDVLCMMSCIAAFAVVLPAAPAAATVMDTVVRTAAEPQPNAPDMAAVNYIYEIATPVISFDVSGGDSQEAAVADKETVPAFELHAGVSPALTRNE